KSLYPSDDQYVCYFDIESMKPKIFELDVATNMIHQTLVESVEMRMASDRPIGCLLSGGLDSSLVASIAAKYLKKQNSQLKLKTFSIGMEGSTDEYYAKLVSKHIGSDHTHIQFPEKDWLDAISVVVSVIESYDVTTVRASTGQYLISKWIAEHTDIKVLLIGDGSDELCAGYMYFHNAPDPVSLHKENVRLVSDIHMYDVLRADRGVSSNGLEARVPFLSKKFIELYLSIDPTLRVPKSETGKPIEKWLLRKSFDRDDYLPNEVLYRKKEAFSDGVSSMKRSWYTVLQEHINNEIPDETFDYERQKYQHCIPQSKEALHFRLEFEKYFGDMASTAKTIPYYWLPKWVGNVTEPSARVLNVYN
ncbi:MAG: asparagine synthetase B, partial [Proteobacteria bacterium]|nr:asparagine synthetase B [Pseudomonadota bacterium]